MGDIEQIKRIAAYYQRLYKTSNPFELADCIGVLYQVGNCKHEGCYMFLKNHRYIFLSNKLDECELRIVMAHELGHAILDKKTNSYFIRNKTLLLNSRLERRANLFAAELLIPDSLLFDYAGFTVEQIALAERLNVELLNLKFNL